MTARRRPPAAERLTRAVERLALAARAVVSQEERPVSEEVVAAISAVLCLTMGERGWRIRRVAPVPALGPSPWVLAGRLAATARADRLGR